MQGSVQMIADYTTRCAWVQRTRPTYAAATEVYHSHQKNMLHMHESLRKTQATFHLGKALCTCVGKMWTKKYVAHIRTKTIRQKVLERGGPIFQWCPATHGLRF